MIQYDKLDHFRNSGNLHHKEKHCTTSYSQNLRNTQEKEEINHIYDHISNEICFIVNIFRALVKNLYNKMFGSRPNFRFKSNVKNQ